MPSQQPDDVWNTNCIYHLNYFSTMLRWWQRLIVCRVESSSLFSAVAHHQPHVADLEAAFVFLGGGVSCLLYDTTTRRLQAGASLACVGPPVQPSSIHPPNYLFIVTHSLINVQCALWCRIIYQAVWAGSVWRLASPPLTLSPAVARKGRIFVLRAWFGNIFFFYWQHNNRFQHPFGMSIRIRATLKS